MNASSSAPHPARPDLAFGCAGVAGLYEPVTREDAFDTLEAAWRAGIRYFDTAPFYGLGLSERRTGDFLRSKPRDAYALSTKVGRLLAPLGGSLPEPGTHPGALRFKVTFDYSYDAIMRSVETSYARLGLDRIDILYVHDLGAFTHGEEENARHFKTFMDSGLKALESLKASGAVSGYGLGVNENEICIDVLERVPLDRILLAGRYTLLDRSAEARLLPLCLERGTELVIGGVFNSGILATGPGPDAHFNYGSASEDIQSRVRNISRIVADFGMTLPQAALNFPASHPAVSDILIGTQRRASLERNLAIFGTPLHEDLLAAIAPYVLR